MNHRQGRSRILLTIVPFRSHPHHCTAAAHKINSPRRAGPEEVRRWRLEVLC
jgi:hypothetical protein